MARRPINRLSAREVVTIKKPGRHADGAGLYLHVDPPDEEGNVGAKRWVFVFQWRRRRKEMGLGSVEFVDLKEARAERENARRLVHEGINPIDARRRARTETPTFGEVADELVKGLALKNDKHKDQWSRSLTEFAAPLRGLPVDKIDTEDVLEALKPIWERIPDTASKVRGRIERVLDAAKARGWRSGENPARWRGHLSLLLPKKRGERTHMKALPWEKAPAFMAELRQREGMGVAALQFTILTAARTGETIGTVWPEIDLKKKVWTVPAARMKAGREHRVPLSDAAVALLEPLVGLGDYVFPGRSKGTHISNMTMDRVLRQMDLDVTVHGFRSTFRDWAGENTNFPREVAEAALAHQVGDEVERAYRRGDALAKRRELMDAWATYLAKPPSPHALAPPEPRGSSGE